MKGVRASLHARSCSPFLPGQGHEILDAPEGWEPTCTSYGWHWSDLQKVWITTVLWECGKFGKKRAQHCKNSWKGNVCKSDLHEQNLVGKRWI